MEGFDLIEVIILRKKEFFLWENTKVLQGFLDTILTITGRGMLGNRFDTSRPIPHRNRQTYAWKHL